MVEYMTTFEITSTTDSEMLDALEWIKDNHNSKVNNANASGITKSISVNLVDATFENAVTTVTAFKTQFTTRLADNWSLTLQ